ncbi:DDE-type integrase/transposase/recombinase [Ruegeria atlantica]
MDDTYIEVRREWMYLNRAVDQDEKTLDFMLSELSDTKAAKMAILQCSAR